jgi:hypothetical protein
VDCGPSTMHRQPNKAIFEFQTTTTMTNFHITNISSLAIHNVGNKSNNDGIFLSKKVTPINSELSKTLVSYFTTSFKSQEYFNLYHSSGDLKLNEVFMFVSEIFDNPDRLYNQSVFLAKHLYDVSTHPKIKGGEFYVVLFNDCMVEGETVNAVGLFKSENKDTFLKVHPVEEIYEIESEKGININKLDKGCIIFNRERESGYTAVVVDNSNRGDEAIYWVDNFLKLMQRQDDYSHTQNTLSLCKNFITEELAQEREFSKADQADLLNKSINFFKEKDSFDFKEFANEVIEQPGLINRFQKYKSDYEKGADIDIADNFTISNFAVKRQARIFKSVLKLDKNFHVYIHGNRDLIERGVDEDGRKYYKLYYKDEN